MKTIDSILRLLNIHSQMTVHDFYAELKISRQYVHRVLNELLELELIIALGKTPKVYYVLKKQEKPVKTPSISFEKETFLKEHFILVEPLGNMLEGIEAMHYWCEKQALPIEKTITEYIETIN